jgi:hypothetical protein
VIRAGAVAFPIRVVFIALTMPFRRPLAFARAACVPYLCWTAAIAAAAVAKEGLGPTVPDALSSALNAVAIVLVLVGLLGLLSFDVNWQRIAYQWPAQPEPFPIIRTDGHRRSQFRLFGRSQRKVPRRLMRGFVVHAAAFLLLTVGLAGVIAISIYFGTLAGTIAFFSLPVIMLSLESSLDWPTGVVEAIDDSHDANSNAVSLVSRPPQRMVAYFLVYGAASTTLIIFGYLPGLLETDSEVLLILGLAFLVMLFLLDIAWITGVGAVLYAQGRTPASVFD